jgi:hypothetical protein
MHKKVKTATEETITPLIVAVAYNVPRHNAVVFGATKNLLRLILAYQVAPKTIERAQLQLAWPIGFVPLIVEYYQLRVGWTTLTYYFR